MDTPSWGAVAMAVARHYLRPLRRRWQPGRPAPTWGVRLGPVRDAGGRALVLRSPRLSDGPEWSTIRLADQGRIEQWWMSSALTWEQRHTEAAWTSYWLHARQQARAGRELPLVVEVDGRMAGQCGLDWIDPFVRSAELGIWLDSRVKGRGLGVLTTAMLVDYAFGVLDLARVTAPVRVDNAAAAKTMSRAGLRKEGTMAAFLDVGGRRHDHDLWAVTVTSTPGEGLIHRLRASRPA